MNEPEQNQPINPDEGQEAAGAAPVSSSSSSSSSDQSAQPEFGQYNQPEYGAMSNQYPANYNPYMYGAPEQPKPADDAQQTAQRPQTNPYMQNGYPANPYDASGRQQSGQPNGYQYGPNQYGPNQYGPNPYQQPGIYPINPNDPSQNPLYSSPSAGSKPSTTSNTWSSHSPAPQPAWCFKPQPANRAPSNATPTSPWQPWETSTTSP